ncbi:unnamed protein product, partial [Prorocentrum cordatum]
MSEIRRLGPTRKLQEPSIWPLSARATGAPPSFPAQARRAPLLRANVPGEGVLAAGHQQREGQAAARGRSADAGGLEELPAGRAGAVAAAPAAQRRHARGFRRPAAAPSRRRRARPWGSCRRPRVQRCRPCRVHCRLL